MRGQPLRGRTLVRPLPKTFRSTTRLVLIFQCVVVLAPVGAALGATFGAMGALACGLLPLAYAGIFARRIGVEATSNGLVLHGYFLTRSIPWRDIDHVELVETWPYNARVVKVGGFTRKAFGLGASGLFHRASMEKSRQMVRELNQIHSEVLAHTDHA